jgi:hypothetical protein
MNSRVITQTQGWPLDKWGITLTPVPPARDEEAELSVAPLEVVKGTTPVTAGDPVGVQVWTPSGCDYCGVHLAG